MKVKQLKRLAELPVEERIDVVAEGLEVIASNVRAQLDEQQAVWERAPRASLLLETLAEEEAAKGFILVDYLRPPRGTSQEAVAAHLRRAYDHMARGVYAEYYQTRPASFGEVMEIVERERAGLYLDGPEGFEWVFRNAIMQRREEAMYVDWVEREGEMLWQTPEFRVGLEEGWRPVHPTICRLFCTMTDASLFSPQGLRVLRKIWSEIELNADTHWMECFRANQAFLDTHSRGAQADIPDELRQFVEWSFLFPLTQRNTSEMKVDRALLEEERDEAIRNWNPWI